MIRLIIWYKASLRAYKEISDIGKNFGTRVIEHFLILCKHLKAQFAILKGYYFDFFSRFGLT